MCNTLSNHCKLHRKFKTFVLKSVRRLRLAEMLWREDANVENYFSMIEPLEKNTIWPMLKQQNTHHNSPFVQQSVVTFNEMMVSIYANDGIYVINTYFHYRVSATNCVIRISEIDKIILTVRFRFLKKNPHHIQGGLQSNPSPLARISRRWCLPIMVNISAGFTIFDDSSWLDISYNLDFAGAVVTDWREA